MKRSLYSLAVILVALSACAQRVPDAKVRINDVEGRKTTSLDGKWRIIVDPYEYGYYDSKMQLSKQSFFKNAKPKNISDRIEYDFDSAAQLSVPGDWNTQRESLFLYEGTVWYKRSFDYQKKPGTRVFLYFGAANYDATVGVNGTVVGRHVGGFTPFAFEVTELLREKDNFVVVKVDNKRLREGVPTTNTDWWNYGGLTRSVELVEVPNTFVEDYFIQLKKDSTTEIQGWVKVNGAEPGQRAKVEIPEAKISVEVPVDEKGYAAVSIPAKLSLWSPEDPKRYDVTVSSGKDVVHDKIGFRSIQVKGTDILLNGKPMFLRGISLHDEAPFRSGRVHTPEEASVLLGWAKELGANFVRLAHYPHNEYMLREADRLGLMVWSESPVYWTIEWGNPDTYENAKTQISEAIARDHNRASIVLWSIANETPVSDARNKFLGGLVKEVRREDPTRLVTAAMLHKSNDTDDASREVIINDPLGAELDVLGCNEYVGWYEGSPESADKMVWKSNYDKPLIMSEFGADALYGLHGEPAKRWTEEYQESVYQHQLAMLSRIPFLRGMSAWVLMDFRSPRRTLPNVQDFFNRKGLVSLEGNRKKAFYVLQKFYMDKAATVENAGSTEHSYSQSGRP